MKGNFDISDDSKDQCSDCGRWHDIGDLIKVNGRLFCWGCEPEKVQPDEAEGREEK